MRKRRFILGIAIGGLLIALLLLSLPTENRLSLEFGPVTYRKNIGEELTAQFAVTNTGLTQARFLRNHAKIRVKTQSGWSTNSPAKIYSNEFLVALEPGAHSLEILSIPYGAVEWQIGYQVRSPSSRRVIWKVLPAKVINAIPGKLRKSISDQECPSQTCWSSVYDVKAWFDAHSQVDVLEVPADMVIPSRPK